MNSAIRVLIVFSAALLTACATTGPYQGVWYEAIRQQVREHCEGMFSEQERDACLSRVQDDYGTFTNKQKVSNQELP